MLLPYSLRAVPLLCFLFYFISTDRVLSQEEPASEAAAALKSLQLAPGFKISLFAAEPMLQNPVAFSIDARGRMFIAETHRYGISIFDITQNTPWLLHDMSFRTVGERKAFLVERFAANPGLLTGESELVRIVEDRDGDGRADFSAIFAGGFNTPVDGTAAGVLAGAGQVWFGNVPGLWRFEIGEDTTARERQLLAHGFGVHIGVTGHDLHGVTAGPDGRIYMSFGDRGAHIETGEGTIIHLPDTGGVLRCEPDGRNLEVFCIGLRNPQDLEFDDLGNLWTVDNDTSGSDPCRVLHLVQGADYGWRSSYQHMKGFGPWIAEGLWRGPWSGILPSAGQVSQGPAGLAWYPGTGLGDAMQGRFLHADFPGGVWSFALEASGASYTVRDKQKLLWNCWPTDVKFGPDGAAYVLDWVSGWNMPQKGRIYRIENPASNSLETLFVKALLGEGMGHRTEAELLPLLGHRDRRVRQEAQFELARRGVDSLGGLLTVAFEETETLPRLHAIWALGQIARPFFQAAPPLEIKEALVGMMALVRDADLEVAGQTARMLGAAAFMEVSGVLDTLLRSSSPRAQLLALEAQAAIPWGRELLIHHQPIERLTQRFQVPVVRRIAQQAGGYSRRTATADELETPIRDKPVVDPFHRHALSTALGSGIPFGADSSQLAAASTHPSPEVRRAALLALTQLAQQRVTHPQLARSPGHGAAISRALTHFSHFLADADPLLVLEAARAINDVPIPEAYPSLAALADEADWAREGFNFPPADSGMRSARVQIVRRALNAQYRLGQSSNAAALARAAIASELPVELRAEAVFLLGQWEVRSFQTDAPEIPSVKGQGSNPIINPENYPQWFDRVVGLWRPLPLRSAIDGRAEFASIFPALLASGVEGLLTATVQAAARLNPPGAGESLHLLFQKQSTTAAVKIEVLEAFKTLGATKLLSVAVKEALGSSEAPLRIAGLGLLDQVEAAGILRELAALLDSKEDVRLKQAALDALGRTGAEGAAEIVAAQMERFNRGDYPPELHLELLESAAKKSAVPRVTQLLLRERADGQSEALDGMDRALLRGGDAARGRILFMERADAACSRCHSIQENQATQAVGPSLAGAGARHSREYLLESILNPNRQIAAGFEQVLLTLTDGTIISGTVVRETPDALEVHSPEDGPLTIARHQIQGRERGLSAMPEGLDQLLSRRELRDLVEFMASLR